LLNDEELLGLIDRTEDSRAILASLDYERKNTSEILRTLNEGTWGEVQRVMESLDEIPEEDRHQIAQALEQNQAEATLAKISLESSSTRGSPFKNSSPSVTKYPMTLAFI
jgi:Mg/Co/Ni transporter MgtE